MERFDKGDKLSKHDYCDTIGFLRLMIKESLVPKKKKIFKRLSTDKINIPMMGIDKAFVYNSVYRFDDCISIGMIHQNLIPENTYGVFEMEGSLNFDSVPEDIRHAVMYKRLMILQKKMHNSAMSGVGLRQMMSLNSRLRIDKYRYEISMSHEDFETVRDIVKNTDNYDDAYNLLMLSWLKY